MALYHCPRCGKPYTDENAEKASNAAATCSCGGARRFKTCPDCGGSKKKIVAFGTTTCSTCGGTGKVLV